MDFLADVWVECPVCSGHRFNQQTLRIKYKHKSIADVLEMDVQDALRHFENMPRICNMLTTLHDVGLDYIKLGQSSTTLSGGEAQRIKLARELVKRSTGRTFYVLDEPTTGLHFEDISRLLAVLHGFVDAGNTVVVIEHNLDVIKTADWIIDLGPEGGSGGGEIIATGTPEEIAADANSATGIALAEELAAEQAGSNRLKASKTQKAARLATMPTQDVITVRGARQHNLRDVDVTIGRNDFTVVTGVSGSGKTSFAIDTVFTEGYRRYVESLSAYARQFLGQMTKPKLDHIAGLSPAICIEQKATSKNPRSTVGTITEIYDYMRVLWARLGTPYSPTTGRELTQHSLDEISDSVMALDEGSPITILAPVTPDQGERPNDVIRRLKEAGFARVRLDGKIMRVEDFPLRDARKRSKVEVVVDRATVRPKTKARITEALEHALALGNGLVIVHVEAVELVIEEEQPDGSTHTEHITTEERELRFSQKLACLESGEVFEELGPHHFSFNGHLGWCETCEGLGAQRGAPAGEIIHAPNKTLFTGAIAGWDRIKRRTPLGQMLLALCDRLEVDPDAPLLDWDDEQKRALLFGTSGEWIDGSRAIDGISFHWRGFYPAIDHATRNSWVFRHKLRNVITDIPCITCRGGRLRADAAAVRFGDATIVEICNRPLSGVLEFFKQIKLDARQKRIAGEVLKEIKDRLQFLIDVGLEYLHLHRSAPTLSGGEAQRIRLASQIGSGLSGVLYVLDEPTIGLHPRDTRRLINALLKLRGLGNTLLVVEHDPDVIASADQLLDFGPAAGLYGGRVVGHAEPKAFRNPRTRTLKDSLTHKYLSGSEAITIPTNRRPVLTSGGDDGADIEWLEIQGARHNNLKNITARFPLGRLSVVTGVSGSGKSSLVNDVLWPAVANELNRANQTVGEYDDLLGQQALDKAINVDQSPIGTTPASNPATYTGVFDWIRALYAKVPDAKLRGYTQNRFSFNRPGGRCEGCEGQGQVRIEMHFMPDVWVQCETCQGKRYNPETLDIRYRDKSIADVLDMRVSDALEHFKNVPKVKRMLQTLADVGLDYVQLGQPAPTLSGGEAQRVKLATELGKPNTGKTLYILDEPTTGLHFEDVRKLLNVLQRLADLNNTVIVVEHNLDVIKSADWIIDLGPEAAEEGGRIVATGTPEELAGGQAAKRAANTASPAQKPIDSVTGAILKDTLTHGAYAQREVYDVQAHALAELATEKAGLGKVGKDVQMPWQVDGRAWHLEKRESRNARERHWEPEALDFVLERVHEAGEFKPTNWNSQSTVEVTAKGASVWFLHALTGGEWVLELTLRAPEGTFDWEELNDALGLKTLDERDDILSYGDWARVDVRPRLDGVDAIVIYIHDREEIDTPAFREFIKTAVDIYFENLVDGRKTKAKPKRQKARKSKRKTQRSQEAG
jgi:excinuclease ABC subunit A